MLGGVIGIFYVVLKLILFMSHCGYTSKRIAM